MYFKIIDVNNVIYVIYCGGKICVTKNNVIYFLQVITWLKPR